MNFLSWLWQLALDASSAPQEANPSWWSVALSWVRQMLSDPKKGAEDVPLWFYIPALLVGILVAGAFVALSAKLVDKFVRGKSEKPAEEGGISPSIDREVPESRPAVEPDRHVSATTALPLADPVADFVGREDEARELIEALKERRAAAVCGAGGVGKTELAYYVARELRSEFSGGQIEVDMRGLAAEPTTPERAMAAVVQDLEPERKLPDDPGQLASLYRRLLAERPVLVLADNAKDSEQVRLLVPNAPSALLVTSRHRIQLPGIARADLPDLPQPRAVELLREILEDRMATDEEIARVAELCACLPLALRVAGDYLAANLSAPIDDYITRVEEKRSKLRFQGRDVMAVLATSVETLARERPDLAAKWRRLAVFPAPFERAAAEAVAQFEDDELDGLVARSLVLFDEDEKEQRFRLHDLMRDLASQELTGHDRYQAERRHAEHFVAVVGLADDSYLQGGERVLLGLRLFDLERPHIEVGQAWAARHAESDAVAANLALEYPLRAPNVLELRYHPRVQIAWLEASLAAARKLKRRDKEGQALGNLGGHYLRLGELHCAIEYSEKALAITRETGNRRGEAVSLGNLGLAYVAIGKIRRAIGYFDLGLAIARELGDRRRESNALGNLGSAYLNLGETRRAIECYEQVLAIARETGHHRSEGHTLGNLGIVYRQLGKPRRAIQYHEQHLAVARETGDHRGEGTALGNLGNVYGQLGETRRAIECYEQHLAIARETGDRHGEGNALGNLGNAYLNLRETCRAIECYEQHWAIAQEIGDRCGEGTARWNRALALDQLGRRAEATADAEAALKIFQQIEDPDTEKVRRQLEEWRAQGAAG